MNSINLKMKGEKCKRIINAIFGVGTLSSKNITVDVPIGVDYIYAMLFGKY
jgi:hypothetical protein